MISFATITVTDLPPVDQYFVVIDRFDTCQPPDRCLDTDLFTMRSIATLYGSRPRFLDIE
jgi:hypothetical protein